MFRVSGDDEGVLVVSNDDGGMYLRMLVGGGFSLWYSSELRSKLEVLLSAKRLPIDLSVLNPVVPRFPLPVVSSAEYSSRD